MGRQRPARDFAPRSAPSFIWVVVWGVIAGCDASIVPVSGAAPSGAGAGGKADQVTDGGGPGVDPTGDGNPDAAAPDAAPDAPLPDAVAPLDVPLVLQNPQLPRGCEVTALAMLLAHAGMPVDKMALATRVKKVPFQSGGLHGNPYDGFVGDMYSFANPGYGVYHGPIRELAEEYLPDQVADLTGSPFDVVLAEVAAGRPVWIITNVQWRALPDSEALAPIVHAAPVGCAPWYHASRRRPTSGSVR